MAATMILAAEKIPRALAALVRACIPLAHAIRDLSRAIRSETAGKGDAVNDTADRTTAAIDPSPLPCDHMTGKQLRTQGPQGDR
jgi:hypothetical protein